ncbi:MAG: DNA (cytosine-5-)-methyltransferase [Opitutia bacterium]
MKTENRAPIKPFRYLSVCSGMEAASVAWHPLGWTPAGFSEIEPFPAAILAHRFPNTTNHGDLTQHATWPIEPGTVDLLVGGTPCQSFSVAGLRKGLADPRGNLALVFLGLADRLKPRWIVWENVPGVLSSNGGRDFGSFLGALRELGYGFAYRVLDAQHFGVPQRRRRVFVVAHLGDWRPAAEVLFEPDCVRRDTKKGKQAGQGAAARAQGGVGADGLGPYWDGGDRTTTLTAKGGDQRMPDKRQLQAVLEPIPYRKAKRAQSTTDDETWVEGQVSKTLNNFDLGDTRTTHAVVEPTIIQASELRLQGKITEQTVCPTLKAGTKQGDTEPLALTFQPGNLRRDAGADPSTEATTTLKASAGDQMPHAVGQPTFPINTLTLGGRPDPVNDARMTMGVGEDGDPQFTLQAAHSHAVATSMAVRRLTPVECERLQGFPDNWSRIPWKGKPAEECPDGPRYKACGNSMAVPVMAWIGRNIANHEAKQAR